MTQAKLRNQSFDASASSPKQESSTDVEEQAFVLARPLTMAPGNPILYQDFHRDDSTSATQTQEELDRYRARMKKFYQEELDRWEIAALEEEDLEARRLRMSKAEEVSKPFYQFHAEVDAELERIGKEDVLQILRLLDFWKPDGRNFVVLKVKQFWIDQGIWDTKWPKSFTNKNGSEEARAARWKHEKPSSQVAYDSDLEKPMGPYARGKRPLQKSRDASRPLYQFMHQVSRECKRIDNKVQQRPLTTDDIVLEFAVAAGTYGGRREHEIRYQWEERKKAQEQSKSAVIRTTPDDISATAYKRVKDRWIERGIWRGCWGILPGLTWAHEHTVEPTESKSTELKSTSTGREEELPTPELSESPKPKKRAYKVTKTSKKQSTKLSTAEPSRRSTRLREAKKKA